MAANWNLSTIPNRMPVSSSISLLQVLRKLLIGLRGDYRENIGLRLMKPEAVLIHTKPEAPADGLAALPLGAYLPQGANLKDVGIVPTLALRAEWENMNFSRVSKDKSLSLSRMMRL